MAFGKPLIAQGTIQADIANARIGIEQSRLLVLKAAHMMDTVGNKVSALLSLSAFHVNSFKIQTKYISLDDSCSRYEKLIHKMHIRF